MAEDKNEFEGITESVPDAEFADAEVPMQPGKTGSTEIKPGDIGGVTFIKNPNTGESIELNVTKLENNPNITGKNKSTGESFSIGCKKKDGTVIRYDVVTKDGVYTVSNWEIFFKLFGPDGILTKYGNEKNTYNGCKIKITKNYNARYANMDVKDVAKLLDKSVEEAEKYKKDISDAMKNKTLYTVEEITALETPKAEETK